MHKEGICNSRAKVAMTTLYLGNKVFLIRLILVLAREGGERGGVGTDGVLSHASTALHAGYSI